MPEHLLLAAGSVQPLQKASSVIADLGCGTGLAGELFKPYAKSLIGVDLSPKMLEIAREKNIYDELLSEDINTYLAKQKKRFDYLLAADVFVYIGNLQQIFKHCRRALKRGGQLLFSTEICQDEDYSVLQSGRFAHSEQYLLSLAKKYHFTVVVNDVVPARKQYDEAVMARVMMLKKAVRYF